jgi:hypothetical protein
MSHNILVQLVKNASAVLPAGISFAGTTVVATDASGVKQNATLTGAESPPWSVTFTSLADGPGSVVAQDVDSTGAPIGSPATGSFNNQGAPPATFPATTGMTVTQV